MPFYVDIKVVSGIFYMMIFNRPDCIIVPSLVRDYQIDKVTRTADVSDFSRLGVRLTCACAYKRHFLLISTNLIEWLYRVKAPSCLFHHTCQGTNQGPFCRNSSHFQRFNSHRVHGLQSTDCLGIWHFPFLSLTAVPGSLPP